MLVSILLVAHVLMAIVMVVIILLQQGPGANAGAAFGSGASGTVFGSRGSGSFLSRMTAVLAALFMLNSASLAWIAAREGGEAESALEHIQPVPEIEDEEMDQPLVPEEELEDDPDEEEDEDDPEIPPPDGR